MPQAAIVIFGAGGIGKTTWAAGITKPEFTRVLAFEGKQEDVIPSGVEIIDVMTKYDVFDAETIKDAQQHVIKELSRAKKDALAGKLRVLVLDGINALAEGAEIFAHEKEPNTAMRSGPIARHIVSPIMLSLHRMPCLVILTAHEASRYAKDGSGKADNAPIGSQPKIGGGGLRDSLASYVSDIWYMTQLGKVRKFMTQAAGQTGPDAKSRLKTTLPDGTKVPLLAAGNVVDADAARALRIYMGWSVAAGGAGQAAAAPGAGPKPAQAAVAAKAATKP